MSPSHALAAFLLGHVAKGDACPRRLREITESLIIEAIEEQGRRKRAGAMPSLDVVAELSVITLNQTTPETPEVCK